MEIKNLKQLRKYIEKALQNSLENEVFEMVKDTESRHTVSDVYDVYKPKIYERRDTSGGLGDTDNIIYDEAKLKNENILSVENATEFNHRYGTKNHGVGLADLIEKGDKRFGGTSDYEYDYPKSDYAKPRPFISNTKEEIKDTKSHIKALKRGLSRNGINID